MEGFHCCQDGNEGGPEPTVAPRSLCPGLSISGPVEVHILVLPWVLQRGASGLQPAGSSPALLMQTLVLLPEADRAEVSRFAKNFLPILFNLYGQPVATGDTPAPRRAVLETIRTYLTITEPQVSW